MKIALLCSGLGNIARGHEVFARDLFELLRGRVDMTLFKGGGEASAREWVIPNMPRNAPQLEHIHVTASSKWAAAVRDQERHRIEHETFAYAALRPLLEAGFDVIHCLEQEVCRIVYANRHLFARIPRVLFSNGGALPPRELPPCDFVQEHTEYNLQHGDRKRGFAIPHGVDTQLFRPGLASGFRAAHGLDGKAFTVVSVGTVCRNHKRMDHVIREVAAVPGAQLIVVGQENHETPEIVALGRALLGERIVFTKVAHEQLPEIYAAADAFALGSLHETFGIVYIEAMAMGLPVFCTDHPNQQSIVGDGVFVNMSRPGALAAALQASTAEQRVQLGAKGRARATALFELDRLAERYVAEYTRMMQTPVRMPTLSRSRGLLAHLKSAARALHRTAT
jgi:1,2-diacylglycerol 3-alpha-glucosyltransferase